MIRFAAALFVATVGLETFSSAASNGPTTRPLSAAATFPTVMGTQSIGPAYHFTGEPPLLESARIIAKLGSNTIKFSLARGSYEKSVGRPPPPTIRSLRDLAENDPIHRAVLDMPFAHTLLWAYPWQNGQSYSELYELTCSLLKTYDGSGRTFYLGNWEGDWELLHEKADAVPSDADIAKMIERQNVRQQAVDDAKRDTPHHRVEVYHYLEVNRVVDAVHGLRRMANLVLPHTPVDFVSYSCYDAQSGDLNASLNYLQSQLLPRPGIDGRRVFIGEYGFPLKSFTPAEQDARSRAVMRTALDWGCRFCMYWELYNNEVTSDGKDVGYAMIDSSGRKLPIYTTHEQYYTAGRACIERSMREYDRLPTSQEFRDATAESLRAP